MDPDDAQFYGKFTKNPMGVAFSPDDNGKQATYFAALGRAQRRHGAVVVAGHTRNRSVNGDVLRTGC